MKVDSEIIENVIDKVTFGADYDDDFMLDFSEDHLFSGVEFANVMTIQCKLNSEAFATYEDIGQVGINSPKRITSLLGRVNGTIMIEKEGSTVKVKDENGKTASITVADPEFIEEPPRHELDYTDEYNTKDKIKTSTLRSIIADAKSLKLSSSGQSAKVYLITENGKLTSKVETQEGDYVIEDSVNTNIDDGMEVRVNPEYFEKLVNAIDDSTVKLELQSQPEMMPLHIIEKTGKLKADYYLAPKMED